MLWDFEKDEPQWLSPKHYLVKEVRTIKEEKIIGNPSSIFNKEKKLWTSSKSIQKNNQNVLIKGDNLLTLKSLEKFYTGLIRVIYIDPPFNTGARINSDGEEVGYDDGYEHSIWLSMMKDRLTILKNLLRKDGSIFVHISDIEEHYLRCLLDEIFGRNNFINRITVRTKSPSGFQSVNPGVFETAEYILSYAKDKKTWKYKPQFIEADYDSNYSKIVLNKEKNIADWKIESLQDVVAKNLGFKNAREARNELHKRVFESAISDYVFEHAENVFRYTAISDTGAGRETVELKEKSLKTEKILLQKRKDYMDRYIHQGQEISFYSKKIREVDGVLVPSTQLTNIWTDISWEGIANEGNVKFKKGKKPEKLLRRIIDMASDEGDWVLDSFAGSGTTGAVAHKMGRRWIMIELGPHAETHCIPRLKDVIEGKDQDKYAYGGGFRYAVLGNSMFKIDNDGLIRLNLTNNQLIEAVCLNHGFKLNGKIKNHKNVHGYASEKRFCFVTEDLVTQDLIQNFSNEIFEDESLVIFCTKKMTNLLTPSNVEVKKIPRDVIKGYEFDQLN